MKNRYSIVLLVFAGSLALTPVANSDSVVRMETVQGNIDLMLLDEKAPVTVDNFIRNYVDKGAYSNSIIHRVATQARDGLSVIQGGGFVWDDAAQLLASVPQLPRIPGEFSNGLHNKSGTIAMALVGSPANVNSATNQWFINTADNSAVLDPQGFTVFGNVLGAGMTVVNNLAGLPLVNTSTLPLNDTLALQAPLPALAPNVPITTLLNGFFGSFPLINYTTGPIGKPNLALIAKIRVMARGPLGTIGTEILLPGDKYAILNRSLVNASVTVDTFASVANPDPTNAPAGITFDQGFYSIKLGNVSPDPIAVVLGVPEDQPLKQANRVYKYGPTSDNPVPHWYDFMYDKSTGTGAVINGSMVMLVFVDGQRGDDDLTKNGVIGNANDVVAVGIGPAVSSGGGGGGAADLWSLLAGLLTLGWKMRARHVARPA